MTRFLLFLLLALTACERKDPIENKPQTSDRIEVNFASLWVPSYIMTDKLTGHQYLVIYSSNGTAITKLEAKNEACSSNSNP